MAKSPKFYVVWKGHNPGVYSNWDSCKAQVDGYVGAMYKSFPTASEADSAFKGNFYDYIELKKSSNSNINLPINTNSICVDAACSGNPGDMEYRGVDYVSKEEIFRVGPYCKGTNNIGEFLAIVHGIGWLQKLKLTKVIYTDSISALSWVRNKKAKTSLERMSENEPIFDLIERAELFLKNVQLSQFTILKWDTENWGEIPADFGRK